MSLSTNTTYRLLVEKLGATDPDAFIGNEGEVFYDPSVASLKLSDGSTAGGTTIGGGGGAGSQTLDETLGLGNTSSLGMSVGVATVTKLHVDPVGSGFTYSEDLVVQGNARVTGILSIGTSSIVLDANNNELRGVQQIRLHSADANAKPVIIKQVTEKIVFVKTEERDGEEVETEEEVSVGIGTIVSINTSGIITASSFGGDGSTLENIVPNIAIASSTTADIEILFEDDYEDGWNGGEVDVYVNDVLVSDNFTIPDDGPEDALGFLSLILNDVSVGSTIKIERVTEGDYPEEMIVNTIRVYGDTTGSLNGLFGTQRYFFGETGIGTTTVTLNVANFQLPPSTTGTLNEVRYNISTQSFELYNGTAWVKTGAGLKIQKDTNLISELTTFPDNGAVANNNDNIFLGRNAGCGIATFSSRNIFIGLSAGQNSKNFACDNNFFGECAGYQASGSCNNFFGECAGFNNTGPNNNFFGKKAGFYNTGPNNNFFGRCAGYNNTTGYHNNFIGESAGRYNTTGNYNFFVGQAAGFNKSTGSGNNFLGYVAGYNITTGSNNNFFGREAGCNQTSGNNNIAIGYNVQLPNLTGSDQLEIGSGSNRWISGDSSFNVGIGTTNPSYKLDVGGDVKVGVNTSQGVILTDPNGVAWRLSINTDGTLTTTAV